MTSEQRFRRKGQTNSQMTKAEREASIAAIKRSAENKRLDHLRRQDDHKQAMENNESVVSEYLESYFGGELNESTSDEDIMEAFDELLETADAVAEYLQEFVGTGDSIKKGAALPPNKKPNGAEMQRRAKITKFKKKWGKAFPEIR
jgi:hypothetical protein